jgi:hypothetical protein
VGSNVSLDVPGAGVGNSVSTDVPRAGDVVGRSDTSVVPIGATLDISVEVG